MNPIPEEVGDGEVLNVTQLEARVGFRIDNLDKLDLALKELSQFSSQASVEEVQELVESLSLPALLSLLLASNGSETLIESASTIGRNYLSTLPVADLLHPKLYRYFLIGLESGQPAAMVLALDQLSRVEFTQTNQVDVRLAIAILSCFEDDSVKVSQAAGKVMLKFFTNPTSLGVLLAAPEISSKLQSILANPKLKVRLVQVIFETLTSTSLSTSLINLLRGADLIAPIFFLHPDDPLLRVALLETFGQYLHSPIPRSLIEEFRVVDAISREINPTTDPAVLRGELRFLAEAYLSGFEISPLHAFLEACLTSESPDLHGVALQVVTRIFEAPAGVKTMRSHQPLLRAVVQLCNGVGQVKADAIACVATLLGAPRGVPGDDAELTQVAQLAYDLLGEFMGVPEGFVTLAQNPALEVKGPAYALLLHLAYYPFGVQAILNSPPTVKFLLDRTADITSLGQRWKYGVVETLSRQVKLGQLGQEPLCAPELAQQLSAYVQAGVVDLSPAPSVALEM